MQAKSAKWLDDIARSCAFILAETAGHSDLETVGRITDYRKIIGFRNRLVHGYDDVRNDQVWTIIVHFLPGLAREVEQLLKDADQA